MKQFAVGVVLIWYYLSIRDVHGQIFNSGQSSAADVKNVSGGGFKPKFPVHCRPMDFDQWQAFQGNEQGASAEAMLRCAILYDDIKLQPGAQSAESAKLCQESFTEYGNWQVIPGDAGSRRLFCDIAEMNVDSQMVRMKQYLESKLVSRALVVDHDIKRQWEKWYDDTNLKLYDFWQEMESGRRRQKFQMDVRMHTATSCVLTFFQTVHTCRLHDGHIRRCMKKFTLARKSVRQWKPCVMNRGCPTNFGVTITFPYRQICLWIQNWR